MGSGLEGFDFSHEEVKRVVGLFTGFVSVIASAPHCFLYLNQRIHDVNKKKKKRKKRKSPLFPSGLRRRHHPHPRGEHPPDGWKKGLYALS